MRAIQIDQFGGPEVLKITELPDPEAPLHSETPGLIWTPIDEAARALPSVFLKALRQGLNSLL